MKRIYLVLLLLLSTTSLFAQKEEKSNNLGVKLTLNLTTSGIDHISYTENGVYFPYLNSFQKLSISPSLFLQNKRKNLWEFSLGLGNFNKVYRVDSAMTTKMDTTYSVWSMQRKLSINLKAIRHLNLTKKQKKFRIFLSSEYLLGFWNWRNDPYEYLFKGIRSDEFYIDFGVSTRLGYNITENLFIEIKPPIYFNILTKVGIYYFPAPELPPIRWKQTQLDFYPSIVTPFNIFKNKYEYRNFNLLTIGYTFK